MLTIMLYPIQCPIFPKIQVHSYPYMYIDRLILLYYVGIKSPKTDDTQSSHAHAFFLPPKKTWKFNSYKQYIISYLSVP